MRQLFVVSWVLLLVLVAMLTFVSLNSARIALAGGDDAITSTYSLEDLRDADPEAATAVRGRRLTASVWALAVGLLAAFVVWVPYRRRERWAWWALLVSLGLPQLISAARALVLENALGAGVAVTLLVVLALALLVGAPHMFARRATA